MVNSITSLKLDFTMHLLIKGITKRRPRQLLAEATPENWLAADSKSDELALDEMFEPLFSKFDPSTIFNSTYGMEFTCPGK